jgi:hypothetical protein
MLRGKLQPGLERQDAVNSLDWMTRDVGVISILAMGQSRVQPHRGSARRDRPGDLRGHPGRIVDLDHQLGVELVVEVDGDHLVGIVHVPEGPFASVFAEEVDHTNDDLRACS